MTAPIFLDIETTGLLVEAGHRIIELAMVRPGAWMVQMRFDPERDIDPGAQAVHGIRREELVGLPRFGEEAGRIYGFTVGEEVVIHNAPFDVGFLDAEYRRLHWRPFMESCVVIDSLAIARARLPGQRHSLDALCDHYGIDRRHRTFHGALTDALLLAEVWPHLMAEPRREAAAR